MYKSRWIAVTRRSGWSGIFLVPSWKSGVLKKICKTWKCFHIHSRIVPIFSTIKTILIVCSLRLFHWLLPNIKTHTVHHTSAFNTALSAGVTVRAVSSLWVRSYDARSSFQQNLSVCQVSCRRESQSSLKSLRKISSSFCEVPGKENPAFMELILLKGMLAL